MPDEKPNLPPPGGDDKKAQRYVDTLTDLIENDKVTVTQTDLSRFNSASMEDHYRVNLHDYDAELSHNRNPETGEETFVMIFNSINKFDMGNPKPVILAYMRLTSDQFIKLKQASDNQLERARKKAEEERFNQTMAPVDELLNRLSEGKNEQSGNGQSSDDEIIDQALEEMDHETEIAAEQQSQKKGFDSMPSISNYSQPETPAPSTDAPPVPDASWE